MLTAECDHVRLALAGEQQQRQGKSRRAAWQMRGLEFGDLFERPRVMALGKGLDDGTSRAG